MERLPPEGVLGVTNLGKGGPVLDHAVTELMGGRNILRQLREEEVEDVLTVTDAHPLVGGKAKVAHGRDLHQAVGVDVTGHRQLSGQFFAENDARADDVKVTPNSAYG